MYLKSIFFHFFFFLLSLLLFPKHNNNTNNPPLLPHTTPTTTNSKFRTQLVDNILFLLISSFLICGLFAGFFVLIAGFDNLNGLKTAVEIEKGRSFEVK